MFFILADGNYACCLFYCADWESNLEQGKTRVGLRNRALKHEPGKRLRSASSRAWKWSSKDFTGFQRGEGIVVVAVGLPSIHTSALLLSTAPLESQVTILPRGYPEYLYIIFLCEIIEIFLFRTDFRVVLVGCPKRPCICRSSFFMPGEPLFAC
jgi:hypothetical protein